jgi:hypothetical protein
MKRKKRPILTPEERAEFAEHQRQLKERIDYMTAKIAAAKRQQPQSS